MRNLIMTIFFLFILIMFSSTVVTSLVSYSTYVMYAFSTRFMVCMIIQRNMIYNMQEVSRDKFSSIAQILLKFANVNYN